MLYNSDYHEISKKTEGILDEVLFYIYSKPGKLFFPMIEASIEKEAKALERELRNGQH